MTRHHGSTLLEILVTTFLLAALLLGLNKVFIYIGQRSKVTTYLQVARQQMNNLASYYALNDGIGSIYEDDVRDYLAETLPNGRLLLSQDIMGADIAVLWGNRVDCEEDHIGVNGCIRKHVSI